jgi:hypothetical protein
MSTTSPQTAGSKIRSPRANAIAGLTILPIEYSLGTSANLYSTPPAGDRGKTLFAGPHAAIGNGPLLVTLHALHGTLLIITGIAAVARASRLGARPLIALSGTALLATLTAWLSGTAFIGDQKAPASLAMALAAAPAILCYALLIFILTAERTVASESRRRRAQLGTALLSPQAL